MRLCAIGNSHVAAVKLAWDEMGRDHDDITIDFFSSPAQSLTRIECEGRRLFTRDAEVANHLRMTSGGRESMEIDDYDHIVILAGGLSLFKIVEIYGRFRSDEHGVSGQYVLSPSAFAAAAWGVLSQTAAIYLWTLLRQLNKRNVTLCVNPLPGKDLVAVPGRENWIDMARNGDTASLLALLDAYIEQLQSRGIDIRHQPACTKSTIPFTKSEYSIRHDGQIHDDVHKTASYGKIILEDVLEHIRRSY